MNYAHEEDICSKMFPNGWMCIGEQFLTYFCKYPGFWRVIIQSCNVEDRIDVFRIVKAVCPFC